MGADRAGVLRAAETPGPFEGRASHIGAGPARVFVPRFRSRRRACRHICVTNSVPPNFGGGFDDELGLTYLEATPDGATAQLTINDKLLQPHGIVHGGVYCSIVESVASVSAAVWLESRGAGRNVVGVNNSTDFIRAITAGVVTAVSTPIHRGRRQQLWLIDITGADDRLVARGQVRLQNLPATPEGG